MQISTFISRTFDFVYVVSLRESDERRDYIRRHFCDIGLDDYQWFDAFGQDSAEVKAAFENKAVVTFPPCFRCGDNDCGRNDCNNFLLPAQVANFLTHAALWKKIAESPQCALVVEDDVFFHDYAGSVLKQLKKTIDSGAVRLNPTNPCLLRLGWALSEDHNAEKLFAVSDETRLSNPCYGMTSAFASKALSMFKQVNTTSDIFLHKFVPANGEAKTVFPPIASELSWSTGEVASLIHPKDIHGEFLDASGHHAGAAEARDQVRAHIRHLYYRRFLITGHPRTGTGYAASLFNQLGFDVGHETAGADGLSSWMFAADSDQYPYAQDDVAKSRRRLRWEFLFHIVRDPSSAVPSIMRDDKWAPISYQFRREHLLKEVGIDLDKCESDVERAVMSLVGWSKMILALVPDLWFRIEDAHEALPIFLATRGLTAGVSVSELSTSPINADKLYQGVQRSKPAIRSADWLALSEEAKSGLIWYCERFGYDLPESLKVQLPRGTTPETLAMAPLGKAFLTPSGWERSRAEQRPVRYDGRALPWFTFGAIEFLHRVVTGGMRVFEYGAGYSTIWWQRAALVHSVDHDPAWVAELSPMLGSNVTLSLIEQTSEPPSDAAQVLKNFLLRPRRTDWDYEPERVVRRGLEDESFLAYAAKVQESGLAYDVIIIDGMARRLCAEFAKDCLSDSGIIVLDNSNRSDYDTAFAILEEAGFFQIPFWGLVPGAPFMTCTSIFAKRTSMFPRARFQPNSFGLPEY